MTAQIAFSKDFMESYSRLPRKTQKKVREFTEKFQQDPTQSGINFERIELARDQKVRSVRVDQAYRAIIVHPPKGDVYLCVWVDHHDDAYRWVKNRRFEVNPISGSFQMYEMVTDAPPDVADEAPEVAPTVQSTTSPAEGDGLFAQYDDEDMLFAGVPLPLLAAVRALNVEADLDALAPHLPADAAEILYALAMGYSLVDAIEEVERVRPQPGSVDVNDFEAALAQPESQQTFRIVENEDELEGMLDAPLDQWRIFLHPSQRKLVSMHANGPVRVLGGAGTGKTVVLMHRANYLASNVFTDDDDRILVTTFTRNLAGDLRMNLDNLCEKTAFARLEVINLHAWADQFMQRQGHPLKVMWNDAQRRHLFEAALSESSSDEYSLAFYMEEWDKIAQAQDVRSRDDYFTARRVGRGTRLGRRQRAEIWPVLARYRQLLSESGFVESQDLIREVRLYIEKQSVPLPYRAVLSDEVQDFTANELKLLRTIAPDGPNTLFVVGDGHQRIYGQPVRLGSCGIEIRGRSRRLKVNYRTTAQIRNCAVAILDGKEVDDLDGGIDNMKGYCSLRSGPMPNFAHFGRENQEAEFITKQLETWLASGVAPEAICLAARTNAQLDDRYERVLRSAGIELVKVDTNPKAQEKKSGVRLATMHRMKGLEFSRVLLAGVQDGMVPLRIGEAPDAASAEDHEIQERCLLYVASTRARDELVVTGYGKKSRFLAETISG